MSSALLLDCTLRDGGFVNDWNFGFGSIQSIISRLDCAGIDIIEVGFIDERRVYDENRSIFPDTDSILPLFKNIKKYDALIVGMIDYGTCSLSKIKICNDSCLDGIRVIFKKADQDAAIDFLSQIQQKGYKIFVNPVSITSYTHEEIIFLIEKINRINPYGVSIVDTYGLMHSGELLKYFDIFNKNLNKNIIIGYHAHNNFQLAYANSTALLNRNLERLIIIDSSLYGMGKSAGNACTELLAMYMNEVCKRNFDLNQIQEAIDVDIVKEYDKKAWGYNLQYYIAALNDCHPLYVQYLLEKKTLSIKSINEILKKIDNDKKLIYNMLSIEKIYFKYQNNYCNDIQAVNNLKQEFSGKKLLLLGPGKTLHDKKDEINEFIKSEDPVVISINFLHESFPSDYVFIGNSKRYSQFFHRVCEETLKIICTSNITEAGHKIDFLVNYSVLLANDESIRDNPLIMFLYLLKRIGIAKIWLAGFDGYVHDNSTNYYSEYIRFLYCNDDVVLRNDAIKKEIAAISEYMQIISLTPTKYLEMQG
jgi:4-hydroxy 2-oxovalerate aldolase